MIVRMGKKESLIPADVRYERPNANRAAARTVYYDTRMCMTRSAIGHAQFNRNGTVKNIKTATLPTIIQYLFRWCSVIFPVLPAVMLGILI